MMEEEEEEGGGWERKSRWIIFSLVLSEALMRAEFANENVIMSGTVAS